MRRPLAAAVAVTALVVLAAAPLAAAQFPDTGTCGPIALNLSPTATDVEAGTRFTFDGTVQNRGNFPGTARLSVDTGSVPDGWTAILSPENVSLEGEATGSFALVVRPGSEATRADESEITVVGVLECGGVQVLQSQRVAVPVTVTPTEPRGGLGAFGDAAGTYGPVVLGLVVLGGFAAAAVVGSGRLRVVGFEMQCPEPYKKLRPGRGTSFPIEVANRGRGPDTAHFLVGEAPDGWTAFTALPEFALGPGEKRTLWLMVRAPEDAPEGERAKLEITVKSDAHPERTVTRSVTAEVSHTPPAGDEAPPGDGIGP